MKEISCIKSIWPSLPARRAKDWFVYGEHCRTIDCSWVWIIGQDRTHSPCQGILKKIGGNIRLPALSDTYEGLWYYEKIFKFLASFVEYIQALQLLGVVNNPVGSWQSLTIHLNKQQPTNAKGRDLPFFVRGVFLYRLGYRVDVSNYVNKRVIYILHWMLNILLYNAMSSVTGRRCWEEEW